MTLIDAGPLVAMINRNDADFRACAATAKRVSRPFVTTWPCFTEAMYLLYRTMGHPGQAQLWRWIETNTLWVRASTPAESTRMAALMEKYQDLPMDLADASLLVAAERLQKRRVFTLDSDFRVYRFDNGDPVDVVP